MSVEENINTVRRNIQAALERSGRDSNSVKLIAVSKNISEDKIMEAYHTGQRLFGENRVQEWQRKSPALPVDCEWHIIGRLQSNKVKYLNESVTLIHSLDRMSLLQELDKEGKKREHIWNALLQVNVARDEAKAGLEKEEVKDFLLAARDYSSVNISGLMTIGALEAEPEETRGYFRKLREIRDQLLLEGVCNRETFFHLSMGMSQDYELAVIEGATMVRTGSVIFS